MKKFSKVSAVILALILAAGLFAATTFASEVTNGPGPCPKNNLIYVGNGNTAGSQSDSTEYLAGQKTIVKDQGTLVKTGYTFDGWNTAADGSGDSYEAGDELDFITGVIHHDGFWWYGHWVPAWDETTYGDKTLYAQWKINRYTMTFDSEGGSAVAPVTQNYNTAVAKPANPAKEGYTFAGWYTGDGGTGSAIDFPYTLTGNVTVYAKWNINYYTMMFNSEGGTNVSPITQAYNTVIAAPTAPTRYGFTFDGWYTGALGTGSTIAFPYTIKHDITVHAKWVANTYTLKFDSEGGSSVASISAYFGEYVNSPADPTKAGYTFEGWYLGDDGTGSKAVFPYNIIGNATLYAKWTKIVVVSTASIPTVASTPSVASITTISSTPAPTSVPQMGSGSETSAAAAIILAALLGSGVAILSVRKIREK
ncbi:MAG TPA: InlB B-repeat-containing protein [Oscillospiraceae bacterium]|nr:InlB B-repeat-containing protein [Oscillospiraceae bacterium]HPS35158.1 InlB B-repeat-containing protein [Oscillospiraceae bacterium]